MVKTCCISGCISGSLKDCGIRSSQNIKQTSIFGIPKDATLLAQWSSILNMTLTKHHCICDYHFKEEDIVKSRKIDYSDGIIKEYELKRWTLLPNGVPVNLQPRQYDIEKPTINVQKPFQQLDNRINIRKKPASTSIEKISPLPIKIRKIASSDDKHPQFISHKTSLNSIPDQLVDKMQIAVNNVETRFDAEQVFLNEIDSNNTPKNIKELLDSFLSVMPEYWYYILHDNQLVLVYTNPFRETEKLRVFIQDDFSVMVSFKKKRQLSLNLKVTTSADLSKLLEEVKRTPVCEGTGIEETSVSGNYPGLILNNYKRLPRNPRCFACRTLRDRLFTKAARQCTAANKRYKSQIPLKRLKNKCNCLQKKVNYHRMSY
ncbi:uncharacterized protein LOC130449912 isoform X1 [Diorhabda sublineata]|uniref:uncharacterized protein LOC130449912 isoform X1 n=1 Tax=Diorhabda sublineata TaxID=1163346 RepID=UPI0024E11CD7|nr:uncharacterized protein LOC130449912 isoform X1 [Diorhabda sublineata]